jgi:Transposase IS116/IS110/IS902 family
MRQVDRLTLDMTRIRDQITTIGRRQPACRALQAAHYGIGPLTSVIIWAEMGDTRRFRSSDAAVRHTGLDVTVYSSDGRRSTGHLAGKHRRCCAGHCMRPRSTPDAPARPITPTSGRSRPVWAGSWRCCRWPASSLAAATTPCATSTTRSSPPLADPSTTSPPASPEHAERRACPAPDQQMNPRRAPGNLVAAGPRAGQPTKNERPHPSRHPDRHLVAGPDEARAPR